MQRDGVLWKAASKAGMSEKTARKYLRGGLPSQRKVERTWRTREDPFDGVWEEVEEFLSDDANFESRADTLSSRLESYLRELRLPAFRDAYQEEARRAEAESLSYEQYLLELVQRECEDRRQHRVERNLRASKLPTDKTLSGFDLKRLPTKVGQQVQSLTDGAFLKRCENVLAFGNPGSGKTHLLCGLGQELIQNGYRVYFASCGLLVQDLLIAKRELKLTRVLTRLSKFDVLILDDIGYVQQNRDEMEVLFTLLAERYETGSVMITSNLPFSKWETIFKDPMTTAAAIDRLVHHSVILELNLPSYRMTTAKQRSQKEKEKKT